MHSITVFDLSQQSYPWWNLAPFGIFVLIGFLLTVYASPVARVNTHLLFKSPGSVRIFGLVLLAAASLGSGVAYTSTSNRFAHYQRVLATGGYQVVEGKIAHFSPLPLDRHGYESFYVQDIYFAYTTTEPELAFHQSSYKQGIIADNVHVRIAYLPGDNRTPLISREILRIEIVQGGS